MVEFARINPTDFVRRGQVFRATFAKDFLQGWLAPTMPDLWARLVSKTYVIGAVVSPQPADGDVAVIDLKAATALPTMSAGAFAEEVNKAAGWYVNLKRLESIDQTQLSVSQATVDRAKLENTAIAERRESNPFTVFGKLASTAKWIGITALVVGIVYVLVVYVPKPKRGRR